MHVRNHLNNDGVVEALFEAMSLYLLVDCCCGSCVAAEQAGNLICKVAHTLEVRAHQGVKSQ